MVGSAANWGMRPRFLFGAAALLAALFAGSVAHAQGMMPSPGLMIGPRVPIVNPAGAPGLVGRVGTYGGPPMTIRQPGPGLPPRWGLRPGLPYVRNSPSPYPTCSAAYRDSEGRCWKHPVLTGSGGKVRGPTGKRRVRALRHRAVQTAAASPTIARELVAEVDHHLSDAQLAALARRHRLVRIASQNFSLLDARIGLFRIIGRRSVTMASRELAADSAVRSVQPNFRYLLQERKVTPVEGDPAQYALARLRLPQAHRLSHGVGVTIAVIDSGIDAGHPELAGSIAESYDALGGKARPHVHGTGVAGAIVAHARLMGSAPAAKILAIRAFGPAAGGVESNSYVILKALDYAAGHGAQIVNMSFAGPKDRLVGRGIAAVAAKGIVMVAAAGNAGARSPPLYPAADPDVIAVSATDSHDRLFARSNRGSYIAVAAPGVDIFLPAPDGKYQVTSGTSFSAAYVSGIAALMLERDPALKNGPLRAILMKTARGLGSKGRDDLFGAGEADADAAVKAVVAAAPPAVAASGSAKAVSPRKQIPAVADPAPPVAAMTSKNVGESPANQAAAH